MGEISSLPFDGQIFLDQDIEENLLNLKNNDNLDYAKIDSNPSEAFLRWNWRTSC
jgi:cellulose biosynthesis protein BcsQ